MQPSPDALGRRVRDDPRGRVLAELYCLVLTVVFHDGNSHARKALTILVVGVWGVVEVGAAFGYANLPNQFVYLRIVVGVLIGRMWGIEINNFAGVEIAYGDSEDSEDADDSTGGSDDGA